jgi:hypothetical protein
MAIKRWIVFTDAEHSRKKEEFKRLREEAIKKAKEIRSREEKPGKDKK